MEENERMGYTSTEVKSRYNKKTYTVFSCALRNEDFERIDAMRGEMSRAAFLKMLVAFYTEHGGKEPASLENSDSEA